MKTGAPIKQFFSWAKTGLEYVFNSALQLLALSGLMNSGKGGERQRVLLSRCDSIGDLILFTAALPSYRALFSDAELILVVGADAAPLVSDCPWVDEIWVLDKSRFRKSIKERWRWFDRLQGGGFDIAVNAIYSRSFDQFDCIVGWTGAPRRIAHRCLDRYKPRNASGLFYNELAPATAEWKPETERNADLLGYLGWRETGPDASQIWTSDEDRSASRRLRADRSPYGVVAPGGGFPEKRWSPELFAETISQISRHRTLHWYVTGTETEGQLCATVTRILRERLVETTDLSGLTTLGAFADLIEHSELVLGNDSSAIHIARALDVPAVFVLGGGHYGRFFSGQPEKSIVPVIHQLPCFQCYWQCILPEHECITRVSPDEMVEAVLGLPKFRRELT